MNSAFYTGRVRHRRFWPVSHAFSYRMTLCYIDLDEEEQLFRGRWFWSRKGFNLGRLKRQDYIGPHRLGIKEAVLARVRAAGQPLCDIARVTMLTQLRLWGVCFNPVTFYYLFDRQDTLCYIVAEVNNTPWLERHAYVLPVTEKSGRFRHRFDKDFHVSPFNPMDMHYQWISTRPDRSLLVHMENHRGQRKHMDATLALYRREWTPWRLNLMLCLGPWRSLKVPLAIYWQAFKLWLKRAPLYDHPKTPALRNTRQPYR